MSLGFFSPDKNNTERSLRRSVQGLTNLFELALADVKEAVADQHLATQAEVKR